MSLVRYSILLIAVFVSSFAYAEKIASIHPHVQTGYSHYPMHVFLLDNNDYYEVQTGALDNIVDMGIACEAATTTDNWLVGDQVVRAPIKRRVWVHKFMGIGNWEEKDTPVLVNKSKNNCYLQIFRYKNSPQKNWPKGKINAIDGKVIHSSSHGLLIGQPNLALTHWKQGDKIYHKMMEYTSGSSWILFNESRKEYAYPFWAVSDSTHSHACYRVLEQHTRDGTTHIRLDHGFECKIPERTWFGVISSPLFSVGDYAMLQVKESGIALVHPTTFEEVYVRTYAGIPSISQMAIDEATASCTFYDYPYKWHFINKSDMQAVQAWNSSAAIIALNKDANGYVLIQADNFWYNSLRYGAVEDDPYTFVPIVLPEFAPSPSPGPIEGILPPALPGDCGAN